MTELLFLSDPSVGAEERAELAELLSEVFEPHPRQLEMIESSRGMFEANGFEVLAESRSFYARVNAESGQQCRYCKPEPCSCNAVLFARRPL